MKVRRLNDIYPAIYSGANQLMKENPYGRDRLDEYFAYEKALKDLKDAVPEIVDGIPEPNYVMMVLDFLAAAIIMIPNLIVRIPFYLAKNLHDAIKNRLKSLKNKGK